MSKLKMSHPHTAALSPPPLPTGSAEESHRLGHGKVLSNLVAAALMLLLGIWLVVSDLKVPGDMLFQGSAALPVLALFVAAFSVFGHFLAVVPVRFLVAANLVVLLRAGFGYPLSLVLSNTSASITASFVVVIFASWYLVSTVRGVHRLAQRPWFRWKHLLLTGLILFCFLLGSVPYLIGGNVRALQNLFGDYIRIGPGGISLVERVLEKGGSRVHLIGMMHIGEGDYYAELKARIAEDPEGTRVVLQEGVRDIEGILPKSFASGSFYGNIARKLGLEMQGRLDTGGPVAAADEEQERTAAWEALGVHFHDADVDICELDEKHQRLLVQLFDIIGASSLEEMLLASSRFKVGVSDLEDLIMNGLIGTRNDRLMQQFQAVGLEHDEVYIPWGAAHLRDIEQRLVEMGYTEVEETVRRVVDFW